ncbi:hypothetical protein, partial [Bosea massiliensis]
ATLLARSSPSSCSARRKSTRHVSLLDKQKGVQGNLNGRQLAEGARATARSFALLIAEAPARNEQELEQKIQIYETMNFLPGEMERSRTAYMVEIAMHADASALGIKLRKEPVATGSGGVQ